MGPKAPHQSRCVVEVIDGDLPQSLGASSAPFVQRMSTAVARRAEVNANEAGALLQGVVREPTAALQTSFLGGVKPPDARPPTSTVCNSRQSRGPPAKPGDLKTLPTQMSSSPTTPASESTAVSSLCAASLQAMIGRLQNSHQVVTEAARKRVRAQEEPGQPAKE